MTLFFVTLYLSDEVLNQPESTRSAAGVTAVHAEPPQSSRVRSADEDERSVGGFTKPSNAVVCRLLLSAVSFAVCVVLFMFSDHIRISLYFQFVIAGVWLLEAVGDLLLLRWAYISRWNHDLSAKVHVS